MNVVEGRYPARDRIWLGVNSVQLMSTAEGLDLEGLRERVAMLAQRDPGLRWFSRPGSAPDRYVRAADAATASAFAQDMVQPLPAPDGVGTPLESAMAAAMDADPGPPQAAFFAGQGVIGHRFPHIFGDGLSAVTHLRRLLTGVVDDPKAPFPVPGVQRPLAQVLRNRWLGDGWYRGPARVLDDLRMQRFAPPPADRPGAEPGAQPTAENPSRVQIVIRTVGSGAMQAIKEWRRASESGASTVSVLMAAIRRGLADTGLVPAEDGMYVVYDLRPLLGKQTTGGNFIAAPYLEPSDALDPVAVNAAVQQANSNGLPLVTLTRGTARSALSRQTPLPAMRQAAVRRDVSFSHIRVGGLLSPRLLAPEGVDPLVVGAAMPGSQGSLSFMLVEVGTVTIITAVFCSPFTPREPVEQVLDRLAKDPVDLLAC